MKTSPCFLTSSDLRKFLKRKKAHQVENVLIKVINEEYELEVGRSWKVRGKGGAEPTFASTSARNSECSGEGHAIWLGRTF
jgi:hypothetical protein